MPDNRRPEDAPPALTTSEGGDLFEEFKKTLLQQRKYYEDRIVSERLVMKRHYERKLAEQAESLGAGDWRNWRGE